MFGKYTAIGIGALAEPVPGTARHHERGWRRAFGRCARLLLPQLALALAPFFAVMIAGGPCRPCAAKPPQLIPSTRSRRIFPKSRPWPGFKRLFGVEGWMNLVKGLAKIAVVGVAIWTQLWPERGGLEAILNQSTAGVVGDMSHLLFKVLMAALSALAVIAGLDYFWQRMRFMSRNRMSKQEIKEEYRQNEGDPTIKAKIRQLRHERARKRMMAAVPDATVVIMNPTHFAVALKYESGKMAAPVCVAKGVDALALRIRAVAEENDVPVVENPPLGARAARRGRDRRSGAAGTFQGGGAGHRLCDAACRASSPRAPTSRARFCAVTHRPALRRYASAQLSASPQTRPVNMRSLKVFKINQ